RPPGAGASTGVSKIPSSVLHTSLTSGRRVVGVRGGRTPDRRPPSTPDEGGPVDDIDWVGIAEKVGIAIVIVIVTWIIATIVSWAIGKRAGRRPALQRQGSDGRPIGASIGSIGSLIVWLFGLVAVLQVFALDAVLAPIQGLLNGVMEFLPNVIGAAFVLFIGYVIA